MTPTTPVQTEIAYARVRGEPYFALPVDLYIPPDALEVFLEAFEGPLDLLLYLIRRQNLDILDIPIADITRQYIEYIGLMQQLKLELAAEYLAMAAILAELKSRLLLPRPPTEAGEDEPDPRAELIRRLQEYERFKAAASALDGLPRLDRDLLVAALAESERPRLLIPPPLTLHEVLLAFRDLMQRVDLSAQHAIVREPLSVRQRMSEILALVNAGAIELSALIQPEYGRRGIVVSFLAILELVRERLIDLIQNAPYAPIHLRPISSESSDPGHDDEP